MDSERNRKDKSTKIMPRVLEIGHRRRDEDDDDSIASETAKVKDCKVVVNTGSKNRICDLMVVYLQ